MSSFFDHRFHVRKLGAEAATSLAELAGVVHYSADTGDGMLGVVEYTANRVEALGMALDSIRGNESRSPAELPDGLPRQRVETALLQLSAAVESLASEIANAGDLRDDDVAKLHKGFALLADTVKLLKHDWEGRLSA